MDDCPTSFATRAVLLPSEEQLGIIWFYFDPDFAACLTFSEDMDTSVVPPASHFALITGGAPETPDSVSWANNRALLIEHSKGAWFPGQIDLRFLPIHPNLKTAAGRQIGSFTSIGTELTLAGVAVWNDPEEEITITPNMDLDTLIAQAPANYRIDFALAQHEPDYVNIDAVRTLFAAIDHADPGAEQVDFHFLGPDPELVTTDGRQLPPWKTIDIGP